MESDPSLSLAPGSPSLDAFAEPLLVDPEPTLLVTVLEAFQNAVPSLVDPDLDELRAATGVDGDQFTDAVELSTLTILAEETVLDRFTDSFRSASRLAALVEAGVCRVLTGISPQPNTVLAGMDAGCVLVSHTDSDDADSDRDSAESADCAATPDRWIQLGDDASLRDRYTSLTEESGEIGEYRIRTPSRHRMHTAFQNRCDDELADDVVRSLDTDPDPNGGDGRVDPRTRAYAAGVCHGALDGDLRRACEDAGLGSHSTFTRIKRELREAGLLTTELVPQPVGRPRERLVATGMLADAAETTFDPSAVIEAIRDAR